MKNARKSVIDSVRVSVNRSVMGRFGIRLVIRFTGLLSGMLANQLI